MVQQEEVIGMANTPDGQMQVQNENNPGPTTFPIHVIGGVVFLTMKDGSIGRQNDVVESIDCTAIKYQSDQSFIA